MEAKNSQEQNEALDQLYPEYGQYVLINESRGIVSWHETHDSARRYQLHYGGIIFNAVTTSKALLQACIDQALQNNNGHQEL